MIELQRDHASVYPLSLLMLILSVFWLLGVLSFTAHQIITSVCLAVVFFYLYIVLSSLCVKLRLTDGSGGGSEMKSFYAL